MEFWKYQGAGNDFIMVDQRSRQWLRRENTEQIAALCDRRFGIGADGLILLEQHADYDFEMIYFNADGRESTMCGNGGRCIAAFAYDRGILRNNDHYRFLAIDGAHEAFVLSPDDPDQQNLAGQGFYHVDLKMQDVGNIQQEDAVFILNTGSPHYVRFVDDTAHLDMRSEGRSVRYSDRFKKEGINVNFVAILPGGRLKIRTYERGVEDETLACGTGVTAAALACAVFNKMECPEDGVSVEALGGDLKVRYKPGARAGEFTDIWLKGPAKRVFSGNIDPAQPLTLRF